MSKKSVCKHLRDQGFDLTKYNPGMHSWTPRCSQCQVAVINGIVCHETGCPNQRKAKED